MSFVAPHSASAEVQRGDDGGVTPDARGPAGRVPRTRIRTNSELGG